MKTKNITTIFVSLFAQAIYSQVGVNTTTPNASAVLDVTSDSKGLLVPRLTTDAVKTLTPTAAEGLVVYNKDKKVFIGWDGTKWQILGNVESQNSESLASWEVNGYSNYGASPANSSGVSAAVSSATIERGSGLAASSGAAANTWGASAWDQPDLQNAIDNGDYALITINFVAGKKVSFTKIGAMNFRRSATGSDNVQWQYSLDNISFTNINSPISGLTSATSGNSISEKSLSNFYDLQNIDTNSVTKIYFRLVSYNGTGGNFYINNVTGNDLEFFGTIN